MAKREIVEPDRDDLFPSYPELSAGHSRRWVEHDLSAGRVRYNLSEDTGLSEHPRHGMQVRETRDETWEIDPQNPGGATGDLTFTALRQRGSWQTKTEARIHFTCQVETYDVTASVIAWEGDAEFHRKDWSFSVPRKLV